MLRAIYWIIFMWIVVRCTSSNYLIHWLGMPSSKLKQENVFYIDSHVIYAQKIFSYACKIINLDNACLIYALAAKQYLKYLKLPIKLYLGVKKENSKFIFHAWLYCGQQKFVGYVGEEQYTILAIFD